MNKHLLIFLRTVGWLLTIVYGVVFIISITLMINGVKTGEGTYYLDYVTLMVVVGIGLIRSTRL